MMFRQCGEQGLCLIEIFGLHGVSSKVIERFFLEGLLSKDGLVFLNSLICESQLVE